MTKYLLGLLVVSVFTISSVFGQSKKKTNEKLAEKGREAEMIFAEGMRLYTIEKFNDAKKEFEKVLEIDPQLAAPNYMIGRIQTKTDVLDATKWLKKALELDKENQYYKVDLAELYLLQKDYPKAQDILAELLKKDINNVELALELAEVLAAQTKYKDALDIYTNLEGQMGISEEITFQKQLIFFRMDKIAEGLKEGKKLIDANPTDEDILAKQAKLLISFGKYKEAEEVLERLKKVNDRMPEISVLMAEIYRKTGDNKNMEAELKSSFDNPNLDAETKIKILQTYMLTLKPTESIDNVIELTRQLLVKHPKEPKGYVILGDLLTKKGQKTEGRNAYVNSTKFDKSVYEVWLAILQLDNELNQIDSLGRHADDAIEYFPNQAFFWYNSGFSHYVGKKYTLAKTSLEEAKLLSQDTAFTKQIAILLGDVYNSTREYELSDNAYEEVLSTDPNNDHVLNNYAYFLSLRNKNLDKALAMSTKLAERNPTNPTFLDTHAWVLFMNADYQNAKTFLETAIKQSDKNATIVEHYGDVLFKLGDLKGAVDQWKKAAVLNKPNEKLRLKIDSGKWVE